MAAQKLSNMDALLFDGNRQTFAAAYPFVSHLAATIDAYTLKLSNKYLKVIAMSLARSCQPSACIRTLLVY